MNLETIEPGTSVRYPRTGTVGRVTRLIDRDGHHYAELDSTGLQYRLDQLIPAEFSSNKKPTMDRSEQLEGLEKERRQLENESLEETPSLDGACSGAG